MRLTFNFLCFLKIALLLCYYGHLKLNSAPSSNYYFGILNLNVYCCCCCFFPSC